jgi:hypothetical protein
MAVDTGKVTDKKDIKAILNQLENDGIIGISVDCVIFGFDENELSVIDQIRFKKFEGKWSYWAILK